MRLPLLLMLPALHALAGPPPAWTDQLARIRQVAEPQERWTLLVRGTPFNDTVWSQDDLLLRLAATQAFRVEKLPQEVAQAYWAEQNWPESHIHWFLLDPSATVKAEGSMRPMPDQVLEQLKGQGFVPRWETRDAFLKEHPDQGEARLEALQEALGIALRRIGVLTRAGRFDMAGGPGRGGMGGTGALAPFRRPEQRFGDPNAATTTEEAARVYKEAADALEAFLQVPGWEAMDLPMALVMPFRMQGAAQAPRMQALAQQMAEALLAMLRQDPHRDGLWRLYAQLQSALGGDVLTALKQVTPVPGLPWPPEPALQTVEDHLAANQNWEALLAFLQSVTLDPLPFAGTSPEAWQRQAFLRAWIEAGRARALAKLERWHQVPDAIQAAHTWAGSRWPMTRRRIRQGIPELRTPERRPVYDPLLAEDPAEDPPLPTPAPRPSLLWLGTEAQRPAWETLKASPMLVPWGPSDLAWEVPTALARQELLQRLPLSEPPLWALVRGKDVLTAAAELPDAGGMAQRLGALVPSRLAHLEALLQREPEHTGLQRARAELLRGRMPNPTLEPTLCESARAARIPPPLAADAPWKPDAMLWETTAQRLLPELEADLRRWPGRVAAWRAWLGWSRFHPTRPTPLALARTLPVWGDPRRWSARLPAEVHEAVAQELRSQGRFEELRAWFQDAWEGLDKRPMGRGGGFRGTLLKTRQELGDVIVNPLREALALLKHYQDLKALEEAYQAWLSGAQVPGQPIGPRQPGQQRPNAQRRGQGQR